MKNKTKSSLTLALGVMLITLVGFISSVSAQGGMEVAGTTGLVKLAPNETLIVSVTGDPDRAHRPFHVDFSWSGFRWAPFTNGITTYSSVFRGVTGADVDNDGFDRPISFDVPYFSNGAPATGGVVCDISCSRQSKCVLSAQIVRTNSSGERVLVTSWDVKTGKGF